MGTQGPSSTNGYVNNSNDNKKESMDEEVCKLAYLVATASLGFLLALLTISMGDRTGLSVGDDVQLCCSSLIASLLTSLSTRALMSLDWFRSNNYHRKIAKIATLASLFLFIFAVIVASVTILGAGRALFSAIVPPLLILLASFFLGEDASRSDTEAEPRTPDLEAGEKASRSGLSYLQDG